MERTYYKSDSVYGVPEHHAEAAVELLQLLPDEWDEALAQPLGAVTDGLGPYATMGFALFRGKRYVAWAIDDPPRTLAHARTREVWVEKARRAFGPPMHPAH